jgi:hypothetical protein
MPEDPRVDLVCRAPSPVSEALALLVSTLGARVSVLTPADVRRDRSRAAAIVLDGVEDGVLDALRPAPALVVAADARALRALARRTRAGAGGRTTDHVYRVAASERLLWPFAGLTLAEERERTLGTLRGPGVRPLVSTEAGPVVAALPAAGLVVTTARPWADGPPPSLLRDAFRSGRFLDVLPALAVVRDALGERGWRRPRPHAVAIVDDPNLAAPSYGYLDYRLTARLAADCGFHLSIGFVPLDFARTDRAVARLFAESDRRLSLVMHGNDHLKRELARAVSDERALFAMRQALARMRRHLDLTGIAFDPVMTMPHGASTPRWVRAMRDVGYTAAITGRAYAFTDDPEAEGAGRLHEFMPAETSLYGFPMIGRWPLERPVLEALFGAFLGKPVCLYTHHQFFAHGWGRFLDAVSLLDRQAGPAWASVGDVVRGTHLVRRSGSTLEVRAYSNDVLVDVPAWAERVEVAKLGEDVPWETERVLVDGEEAAEQEGSATRIAASARPDGRERLRVRFVSTLAEGPATGWERAALTSWARRRLTEARDRLAPVLLP